MSKDSRTAFVIGRGEEAERAATALRGAGYQAVTGAELDEAAGIERLLDNDIDGAAVAQRDMRNALDCDIIVLATNANEQHGTAAIVRAAMDRAILIDTIGNVCPNWDKEEAAA